MPMDSRLYPVDWKDIAREIKEAAGWTCGECGMQCRRPGEPFDTHRRTLTVSHYFHDTQAPEVFLVALCSACHLRHDAQHHAAKRRRFHRRHHMALILREPALTREDVDALAADWPTMPDLDGVDLFAQHPVYGGDTCSGT